RQRNRPVDQRRPPHGRQVVRRRVAAEVRRAVRRITNLPEPLLLREAATLTPPDAKAARHIRRRRERTEPMTTPTTPQPIDEQIERAAESLVTALREVPAFADELRRRTITAAIRAVM